MTEAKEEFGWSDALPPPQERQMLPVGDAEFEVLKMERARKEMGKLGMVNVAILNLMVKSLEDESITSNVECLLPLSSKVVFKIYQFFASIGQYDHGDVENGKPFAPDWTKVVGSTGLCVIKHRAWKGKDGAERTSTEIDMFLDPKGRARASDKPRAVGATDKADDPTFDQVPF
jgi:hypothetical protein